jgi:hypothetical protein
MNAPDLNQYREEIRSMEFSTSDGGRIVVEMQGQGRIEIIPWSSEPSESKFVGTYEDRVVLQSGSGNDVTVLQFLAKYAAYRKELIDAEQAEAEQVESAEQQRVLPMRRSDQFAKVAR